MGGGLQRFSYPTPANALAPMAPYVNLNRENLSQRDPSIQIVCINLVPKPEKAPRGESFRSSLSSSHHRDVCHGQ